MNALVTGAGGFLGRHVVAELRRRGHAVRALIRPSGRIHELSAAEGVEVHRADLLDRQALGAAFVGMDVLIHLAARLRGTPQEIHAAAVTGSETLLEAMARSDTARIVLAGSMSVYDWAAARGELTEESPLEGEPEGRDAYTAAKLEQERLVRRTAAGRGWDLTVLRPGFIWGAGHAYLPCLGHRMGPIHLAIAPAARPPLTYVENCASCFATAAEDSRARGGTFNVVDGDGVTSWEFLGGYLRRSGERGIRVPVPYRPARSLVSLANAVGRRLIPGNRPLPGLLHPRRFEARFKPLRFSNRKVRDVLGWSPPFDHQACLDRSYGRSMPPRPSRVESDE